MGTQVQSKTYFPGSMTDVNTGFCNGVWDLYHDEKSPKVGPGPRKGQHYDYFLMRQTMDGLAGYAKEQIRQTILKQESIFRHQLQELHRLYKRQRDLMNLVPVETSKLSHFLSQVPSEVSKETHNFASGFSLADSTFSRVSTSGVDSIFSPLDSIKGRSTLKDVGPLISKCGVSHRRVIDLELPADVDESDEGKQQVGNVNSLSTKRVVDLADLNEPIKVEEMAFTASVGSKSSIARLAEKLHKKDLSSKRTIFGVEICERNHTPSFDSMHTPTFHFSNPQSSAVNCESSFVLPWRKTTSSQNASTLQHNHWLCSSDSSKRIPELFAGKDVVSNSNSRLTTSSRSGVPYHGCISSSSAGLGFLNGINLKNSVSDSLEELHPLEKHEVIEVQKNHETPERGLPLWLTAKPCLQSDQIKGKQTPLYQMNLDSLQNHSQQFFKKAEMAEGNDTLAIKNVKTDDFLSITKILGVSIDVHNSNNQVMKDHAYNPKVENHCEAKDSVKENGMKPCISNLRHHIDLNLSLDEEDAPPLPPSCPEPVVKIATMEIDLEAPAILESETDHAEMPLDDDSNDTLVELVKVAAEAIMSISSSKLVTVHHTCQPPADTLLWFAEVITSPDDSNEGSVNVNEESVPEGLDYFEYMTLKLQDTQEDQYRYKPMILEEKEDDTAALSKRTGRKGPGRRGRQRKDFQKDILPSIVSLSRREVNEDLQTFEEAFAATGVSWQSSLSKRKAAARNGRARRRLVVPDPSCHTPSPPPVEQTVCRELALEEKSLGGWGRRTRRLPRQRCPNSGNHQSLTLKC